VARLFPPQGAWTEEEFLALPGNRVTELDDGRLEVLEMPSELHQLLVAALYGCLRRFVDERRLGTVLFAPFPVRLWEGKVREPDVLFMAREHAQRRHATHWIGADLVMEVVSAGDPARDKETKRREYAQAGIPEFWLVDPSQRTVTVLALPSQGREYVVHGTYQPGARAQAVTLAGFGVAVDELFAVEAAERG
jgi:Uma2 family endonuclease